MMKKTLLGFLCVISLQFSASIVHSGEASNNDYYWYKATPDKKYDIMRGSDNRKNVLNAHGDSGDPSKSAAACHAVCEKMSSIDWQQADTPEVNWMRTKLNATRFKLLCVYGPHEGKGNAGGTGCMVYRISGKADDNKGWVKANSNTMRKTVDK